MRSAFLPRGLVCLLILLTGCGGGGSSSSGSSSNNGSVTTTGQYQTLRFTLTAPKRVYARGEAVTLTFTVKNTGTQTATLVSPRFSALLTVGQNNQMIWRQAPGGGGGINLSFTLLPGETKVFNPSWLQVSNGGNVTHPETPVSSGRYLVKAYLDSISVDGASVNDEQQLSAAPLEVEVK